MLLGGPNVAVPYGEKVFSDITAPTVMSQMALAGLGNSGAAGENLALAGEQMALPLAQQGLNLELSGAQGLSGLGTSEQNNALQASIANQQAGLTAQGMSLSAREAGASGLAGIGNTMAQQRLAAAGGLGNTAAGMANLGSTSFAQGMARLNAALQASGMPQQEAQAVLDAIYKRQAGQTGAGLNTQDTLMSWLPGMVGQHQQSSTSATQGSDPVSRLLFG